MKISASLVELFARGTQICYSTSRWGRRNFIRGNDAAGWQWLSCAAQLKGSRCLQNGFEACTVPRLTSDISGPCCPEMLFCPWTSASTSFHPLGPHLSLSVSYLHALPPQVLSAPSAGLWAQHQCITPAAWGFSHLSSCGTSCKELGWLGLISCFLCLCLANTSALLIWAHTKTEMLRFGYQQRIKRRGCCFLCFGWLGWRGLVSCTSGHIGTAK